MPLYLRKVTGQPQAPDNYRVILKSDDEDDVEVGSLGIQLHKPTAFWSWGIDTAIPMQDSWTSGTGTDRTDCMRHFEAAWKQFSADEANLTSFLKLKRNARRSW